MVADFQNNPLTGVSVAFDTQTSVTQADGKFTFTVEQNGRYRLKVDGKSQGFGVLSQLVDLQPGDNTIPTVYLPLLPLETQGVQVDPTKITILTEPTTGIIIEVTPGSVKNLDGTLYTGKLMVLIVPPDRFPVPFPEGRVLQPLINIQPTELMYSQPYSITIPNTLGYPEGMLLDIWRLSVTQPGSKNGLAKVRVARSHD